MWMMHTTLPEFYRKMKTAAATQGDRPKECEVVGLENYKTAKMQSLRTGRIEQCVAKIAQMEDVDHIEVAIMDRVPETILERINPEQQKSMLSILSSNASMELTLQKCRMDCKRFTIVCLKSTPPKSYLDIIKLMKMAYGAMIICLGLEERGHLMM